MEEDKHMGDFDQKKYWSKKEKNTWVTWIQPPIKTVSSSLFSFKKHQTNPSFFFPVSYQINKGNSFGYYITNILQVENTVGPIYITHCRICIIRKPTWESPKCSFVGEHLMLDPYRTNLKQECICKLHFLLWSCFPVCVSKEWSLPNLDELKLNVNWKSFLKINKLNRLK